MEVRTTHSYTRNDNHNNHSNNKSHAAISTGEGPGDSESVPLQIIGVLGNDKDTISMKGDVGVSDHEHAGAVLRSSVNPGP